MKRPLSSQRGSLVLVGMILTVTLGLILGSYISLCSNSLQMSQREYQSNRAQQLAEDGMEEALWALNQTGVTGFVDGTMGGGTIDWTLEATPGTATATITGFPAEGGLTRQIGIRVLNYKAPTSGISAWSAAANYAIGNYAIITVGGTPTTFCCATANLGHSPAPGTATDWNSATAYALNAYALYGGTLYRCKTPNTGKSPEKSAYWTPIWIGEKGQIINTEGVITLADGTQIRRQLRALTTPPEQFLPNALAAVNGGAISLSNIAAVIDSYDSAIGPYNAGTATYSAVVAGTTVDINSATVKGYVVTTGSAVLYNPDGYILAPGDTAVRNPARILTTATVTSVIPLSAPAGPPIPTIIHDYYSDVGTNPIWNSSWSLINTLSPGTYRVSGGYLHLMAGHLYINGPGTVKLIASDDLFIGDPTNIGQYRDSWNNPPYAANTSIMPGIYGITVNNGAKLELYVGGNLAIYAGGINNLSQNPANVTIYGTNTTGSPIIWDIRTNQKFYGTINAPRATFTIYKDTGTPNFDFFGAVLAKNINLRGGASVHYDMDLRNSTPSSSSTNIPSSRSLLLWREVGNAADPEFHTFNYP